MAEIFLAGILVSFVKLMAYGDVGIGSSFIPWCLYCVLQLRAFQCVDRRWAWDDIAPAPTFSQTVKAGVPGIRQVFAPARAAPPCCLRMLRCVRAVKQKVTSGVKIACNGPWRC